MGFSEKSFPVNRRAVGVSIAAQLGKVCEEFAELANAYYGNDGNVLEEAMDLRIAVDGFIDLYPQDVVDFAYAGVVEKGVRRGDWDGYPTESAVTRCCNTCLHFRDMSDSHRKVCVLHNHLTQPCCYCSWHKLGAVV